MTTPDDIERFAGWPDERLAALPLVSIHDEPQLAPQQYECGCVTVTRITDRDHRRGEKPFEMRLALACGTDHCDVPYARYVCTDGTLITHAFEAWCYCHLGTYESTADALRGGPRTGPPGQPCNRRMLTCGACGRMPDNAIHKAPFGQPHPSSWAESGGVK